MKFPFPVLVLLPAIAVAQPAPKPPALAELNKRAVDILRDMHDRGADLYNAGDSGGAVRVYQTALGTVAPFLAHHPDIQKAIATGLADADKLDGNKAKAFRLHEIIEQIRSDLRAEARKFDEPTKPKEPALDPKPKVKPEEPKPLEVAPSPRVPLPMPPIPAPPSRELAPLPRASKG